MLRRYDLAMWKKKIPSSHLVREDLQGWPFHIPPTISFLLLLCHLFPLPIGLLIRSGDFSGYHIYCCLYAVFLLGSDLHFLGFFIYIGRVLRVYIQRREIVTE